MKVDLSNILKVNGASLDVEFEEILEGFTAFGDDFVFDMPVKFSGRFTNMDDMIKLDGHFQTGYIVKCSRCLKDVRSSVEADLSEGFVEADQVKEDDSYTYKDKAIELDKVLKDNIILNLPTKQVCSDDCKGLCPECGIDLNDGKCSCSKESIDPRMEALKGFF